MIYSLPMAVVFFDHNALTEQQSINQFWGVYKIIMNLKQKTNIIDMISLKLGHIVARKYVELTDRLSLIIG